MTLERKVKETTACTHHVKEADQGNYPSNYEDPNIPKGLIDQSSDHDANGRSRQEEDIYERDATSPRLLRGDVRDVGECTGEKDGSPATNIGVYA